MTIVNPSFYVLGFFIAGCILLMIAGWYFILAAWLDIQQNSMSRKEYLERRLRNRYVPKAWFNVFVGFVLLGVMCRLVGANHLVGKIIIWSLLALVGWLYSRRVFKKNQKVLDDMNLIMK